MRHGYYSSTSGRSWQVREAGRTRTRLAVLAFVQYVLAGKPYDWVAIGRVYRPEQQIPAATVRRLFRQEEVKAMIAEELHKVLSKDGVDQGYVISVIKRAISLTENKGGTANMLKGATAFADILDMKPKTWDLSYGPVDDGYPTLTDAEIEEERRVFQEKVEKLKLRE